MTHKMKPRYTVTADDMAASFLITQPRAFGDRPRGVPMPTPFARDGIALEKNPLPGTAHTFQLGISETNRNESFQEWRERCEIPFVSGRHSGVVVFDGDKVIAGYTAGLHERRPNWTIGILPDYRGQGLSALAIAEWFKAAPFLHLVGWPVSPIAAKSFVAAHKLYLAHAIATLPAGTVPQNVIDSVA